jgi:sulfide:quinone oxidoreductase
MPQHIVIVGGGVGGTIVANLLARHLHLQETKVTLIENTGKHAYMPGWLYMPFNHDKIDSDHIIRDERDLLNRHVHHVLGEVTRIDTRNRELLVRYSEGMDEIAGTGGAIEAIYAYDYLVLASGARLAPSDLSGLGETESLGQWHHFYSAEGALELRKALQHFEGGRIVITVGGIPYRCPPAPLEFTFQLEEWLHRRGLRERTEIHYLFPLPRVFPIESVAEVVTPLLEERHIHYTIFFNVETVDTEHKVISSLEGEEVPYDLLVVVPPHYGARVIEESGLGDAQGWLPTDRNTLEVKGHSACLVAEDSQQALTDLGWLAHPSWV